MLIIYAHPNQDGHSGAILKEVERILKDKKVKYDLMNLYAMHYNPVLGPDEHYTSGNRKVSEENRKIQERIKRENKLIFIYPTWWNNMPAILKGFFDRVFTGGFAFRYIHHYPLGLLKGKKAVIFSSCGAARWLMRIWAKDRAFKTVSKDVLKFSGIKSRTYVLPKAREFNSRQEMKIKKMVKRGLRYLGIRN
jgi:NAD(P)H dehydrogenase (quinone)